MAKNKTTTQTEAATEAYRARVAEIEECMRRIKARLKAHHARQKTEPRNWGFVGDLGHVTELLNALNPARRQDPYTELKCAVLRFPVRNGIATISNGIAAETNKVRLIGGGTINLRNETLELGFRPEAARGLGVGAGNLARFAKVEGTLANPRIGLDMAGTATAAAVAGAAIATGGLTLLAGGLLIDSVPDNPCQVALSGVAPKQKSTVDRVLDPIKRLFGN